MSIKIELTTAHTNLQVNDALKDLDNDKKYRVVYIDVAKGIAVLTSLNEVNDTYILDLKNARFEIITHDVVVKEKHEHNSLSRLLYEHETSF
jgi:hypothetical protein